MTYVDDLTDLDYQPEDEIGVKRAQNFDKAIINGMRYGVSFRALSKIINDVLTAVNRDDLWVSKSGLEKWNKKIGKKAVQVVTFNCEIYLS